MRITAGRAVYLIVNEDAFNTLLEMPYLYTRNPATVTVRISFQYSIRDANDCPRLRGGGGVLSILY